MKIQDGNKKELTCITFDFSIGWYAAEQAAIASSPVHENDNQDMGIMVLWGSYEKLKGFQFQRQLTLTGSGFPTKGRNIQPHQNTTTRALGLHLSKAINTPRVDEKCSEEMKGMRGKFLGKLKSISAISTLKQGLVFHDNIFNQYFQTPPLTTNIKDEDNFRSLVSLMEMEKNVPILEESDNRLLLAEFEEKCPPGGNDSVIFYTTSLRGIRKTFEDCNTIRFLLGSFQVLYDERDVSMHMEFREELWRTLGSRVIPPRLFIKGRLIGGVEEVVGLHEEGKLEELLSGIPKSPTKGPGKGCGGMRFVLCSSCSGSRKVVVDGVDESDSPSSISCVECNENGSIFDTKFRMATHYAYLSMDTSQQQQQQIGGDVSS
nr:putative glutaredoxin family protein [Tanacetum cinerariifolium]